MSRGSVVSKERRRRQAARAGHIVWTVLKLDMFVVNRPGGRSLLGYIAETDNGWMALAIEGATKALGHKAVLDDHGHRSIGEFATFAAARRATETFAREWLRSRKSVDDCACETIATAKAPKKRT